MIRVVQGADDGKTVTLEPSAAPRPGSTTSLQAPASRSLDEPELPRRIGRFHVLEPLGAGGMGQVVTAYDASLDRKVAIKVVRWRAGESDSRKARMLREARALARLSHPNVVHVYEVGELDDGRIYVAMEFVAGQTLAQWLATRRPWREVVDVFIQCGEGLAAAHREGMVHRDFKPTNAMIDDGGRVRVLDFGLVRAVDAVSSDPADAVASHERTPDAALTQTGITLGTPAYMAPEQHRALPVDARADQFSLCVSLFEGLYGYRPFAGKGMRDLAAAVTSGEIRDRPTETDVPGWIEAAVLRGLAVAPQDRWPTVDALLDALRGDRGRPRWTWIAGGLVVVAAAAGIAVGGDDESTPEDGIVLPASCDDPQASMAQAWSDARRDEVRQAFARVGTPYAAQAAPLLEQRLDAYADGWVAMHRDACQRRAAGEQSEELLSRRLRCLRHRRVELGALVDRLTTADEALVRVSLAAAAGLSGTSRCADEASLQAQPAAPTEPALAQQVQRLRDELARATADDHAGLYEEAKRRAESVSAEATAIGYAPLRAEAGLRLGLSQERTAAYEEAERDLLAAYVAAETANDDRTRAQIAAALSFVAGVRLARVSAGLVWSDEAMRLTQVTTATGTEHAQALTYRGALDVQAGQLDAAVEHYAQALAALAAADASDDPRTLAIRLALGAAFGKQGKLDEARGQFEQALRYVETTYGDLHPTTSALLNNLGTVAYQAGRLDDAVEAYARAIRIGETTLGPDHPELAATLSNLGSLHTQRGDLAQARQVLDRALQIRRTALGPDHPKVATVLNNLGEVHLREDDPAGAVDLFARALVIFEKQHGREHPVLDGPLSGLGVAKVALGEHTEAIALLERAEALDAGGTLDEDRIVSSLALAEAKWAAPVGAGRDRTAARTRAQRLLRQLQAGTAATNDEVLRRRVQAWLQDHPPEQTP